ncbi:MAG: coenzyme F420-0:L-glutamate ligase [Chloroflexi bacterium]|nr:coenzyme F420-0:L-glutamate ligase [Chloroflexota bacterium]MCI0577139.1 coenzyme F420-0:L-glutamate ligase [Chloroflexota bacterium]MCI0644679.1 coenzyme F420-0:L-glutamate ligase [Chloroflexota bacterium]MCI0730377.1 coenzyme F420-0:L-glutamate ligase [Chloroflexota bacterium]
MSKLGLTSEASITLTAVPGFPEVRPGDDVAELLLAALDAAGLALRDGDVLAIAHKVISKAEGRQVELGKVTPSQEAHELAAQTGKDPRLVELILRESVGISRMRPGLLIVRHRLGFTSANAGIDRSNVAQSGQGETVVLLPLDPDGSAARLRQAMQERWGVRVGVLITDSHGRPFRLGTVGVAIGLAGLPALWDRRGEPDRYGYRLQHTEVGTADEIAAAAGLLMGQAAEGRPVVLIRGLQLPPIEGQAGDLIRPPELDLYR